MSQRSAKLNALQATVERYAEALPGSQAATYLATRGFDETSARGALLGMVVDPPSEHQQMEGMLCIPYLTPSGVVAVKFRSVSTSTSTSSTDAFATGAGSPKYLIPSGQKTRLFNVMAFQKDEHRIAICEGELDALTLHLLVGVPSVGVPGVQNWKQWYARCFDGYAEVLVFADNDLKDDGSNPGQELGRRIVLEVPQARVVQLPRGEDVSSLFVKSGKDAVLALIETR